MEATLDFKGLAEFVEASYGGKTGSLVTLLDQALSDCTHGLDMYGGKAGLKLTLSMAVAGRKMTVKVDLATTLPEPVALPCQLFLNKRGEIVLDDPQQLPLPFVGEVVK